MRIVSVLPTATEIVYELGLGRQLVGVSHECDYPAAARTLPRVSRVEFDYGQASSRQIDDHVRQQAHEHRSLYQLDGPLLEKLRPTHLITQQLCEVCAITPDEVQAVVRDLLVRPELVSMNPGSLDGICDEVMELGRVLGREEKAGQIVGELRATMSDMRDRTRAVPVRTVFAAEWLDPLYASGHWVPEMVRLAGGQEVLGAERGKSRRLDWRRVAEADPEVVILMPCGLNFEQMRRELPVITTTDEWRGLRAVREGRVWLVDAPAYFSQSGPRVIRRGIPLLGQILHPELFGRPDPTEAVPLLTN